MRCYHSRIFDPKIAEDLVAEMGRNREFVNGRGQFADDSERKRVLNVYDEAIKKLKTQIGR